MLQLALTIWGIVILAKRRVKMTKNRVVTGGPAIAIGAIFVSLLPVGFMIGLCMGVFLSVQGIPTETYQGYALIADLGLLVCALVAAFAIAGSYGRSEDEVASAASKAATRVSYAQPTYAQPADASNPYNPPGNPS